MTSTDWRDYADKAGDCWMWVGTISSDGYAIGWFSDKSERVLMNRVALESRLGRPITSGMWALHTCDNRRCVNPEHLYEGTAADNGRDMAERGRARNGYTVQTLGRLQPLGSSSHLFKGDQA